MRAGDLLVSSGMGQVYPKNYPVAEITSVYSDPGQDFATVTARPLAQMASTRHVMLVFASEQTVIPSLEETVGGTEHTGVIERTPNETTETVVESVPGSDETDAQSQSVDDATGAADL